MWKSNKVTKNKIKTQCTEVLQNGKDKHYISQSGQYVFAYVNYVLQKEGKSKSSLYIG